MKSVQVSSNRERRRAMTDPGQFHLFSQYRVPPANCKAQHCRDEDPPQPNCAQEQGNAAAQS
jgi:hypothetical protein